MKRATKKFQNSVLNRGQFKRYKEQQFLCDPDSSKKIVQALQPAHPTNRKRTAANSRFYA